MVQSVLVDRTGCGCCLSVHAAHWPNERSRITSLRWIKFSHRRFVSHWSGRDFSSDASFDARTGQFTDRLCGCIQSDHLASSELLVADRFRAGGILFRLHLATLCRKGKRSARYSRFLLVMTAQLSDETAIVCEGKCKRRRRDMFIAPDIKYPLSSVGAAYRKTCRSYGASPNVHFKSINMSRLRRCHSIPQASIITRPSVRR